MSGWSSSPEKRRRDSQAYGDPEYRKNRAIAKRRANGTCAQCGHRHARLECDHIAPKSVTGKADNSLKNLQMLCTGEGSCKCHEKKTYQQRGGSKRMAADPQPRRRMKW